ncbi:Dabb family protein [Leadbetterella byssophila]|jgi:hypothetical protein|uniref:Dabb family protein n=1 Tax=Leadbetterella byssophila TaxID=316068 RepID=UPI00399F762B
MNRRDFVGGLALSGGLLTACGAPKNEASLGGVLHYVLFWLREDLTEKEVEDFVAFFEELRKIPEIKTLNYGRPAATNPRPVVDNSFSYNLIVTFDSLKEVGVYENHPIHLEAIKNFSHFWTKVVVHDTTL